MPRRHRVGSVEASVSNGSLANAPKKVHAVTATDEPVLNVRFYATAQGREPVREWLGELNQASRKAIGADIKTVQFGWPLGMPLVRKLQPDLWEVRVSLPDGIARVLFTTAGSAMVLLHGFIKKSQNLPQSELEIAKRRMKEVHHG
jgi:phage-related protein